MQTAKRKQNPLNADGIHKVQSKAGEKHLATETKYMSNEKEDELNKV